MPGTGYARPMWENRKLSKTQEKYENYQKFFTAYTKEGDPSAFTPMMLYARQLVEAFVNNIAAMHGIIFSKRDLSKRINQLLDLGAIGYETANIYHRIRKMTNNYVHAQSGPASVEYVKEFDMEMTEAYYGYMEHYGGKLFEEKSLELQKKQRKLHIYTTVYGQICLLLTLAAFIFMFLNRDIVYSWLFGDDFSSLIWQDGITTLMEAMGILFYVGIGHFFMTVTRGWIKRIIAMLIFCCITFVPIIASWYDVGLREWMPPVQEWMDSLRYKATGKDSRIFGSASYEGLTFEIDQVYADPIEIKYSNGGNSFSLGSVKKANIVAETDQGTYYAQLGASSYKINAGDEGVLKVSFPKMEGDLLSITVENVHKLVEGTYMAEQDYDATLDALEGFRSGEKSAFEAFGDAADAMNESEKGDSIRIDIKTEPLDAEGSGNGAATDGTELESAVG